MSIEEEEIIETELFPRKDHLLLTILRSIRLMCNSKRDMIGQKLVRSETLKLNLFLDKY